MEIPIQFWLWLKEHDAPNWINILFSLIIWPLVLYLWNKRTVRNVPNLEVTFSKGAMAVNGNFTDTLKLKILNNTGSIVYISNARIANCSKKFRTNLASHNIADPSSYELIFGQDESDSYHERRIILQTDGAAFTALGINDSSSDELFTFKPSWCRRLFKIRKYFTLEYVAMVGDKRHKIKTIY